jgi:hypothetical protein
MVVAMTFIYHLSLFRIYLSASLPAMVFKLGS